jgi:macrolide transport system ATP-binding/permease protein
MALGAETSFVYRMILKEAGRVAAVCVALGFAGSMIAGSLARSLLFGVSTWDVQSLFGVAAVLLLAAALASFVPARRAASVNPVEALRSE